MSRAIVIAEAGVNHNGDIRLARRMVKGARAAGADYVKFQTFVPEKLISGIAPKAEYQKQTTDASESQLDMLRGLCLPAEAFAELSELCRQQGIGFVSTPFDLESIDVLARLGMDFWKIPSGEITNLPYLRKIGKRGEEVIMSTGMASLAEVEAAVKVLEAAGTPRSHIRLLHCTTQYPAPADSVNLRAMDALRSLGCAGVGYSDHTRGYDIPLAAVAMGAEVIEKHFTLDRTLPGPDHRASLEPGELKDMISAIRRVESAMGSGIKAAAEAERANITVARKSIVAARHISKGEILTEQNLAVKRPGGGVSPMLWDSVVGTRAIADFDYDQLIQI